MLYAAIGMCVSSWIGTMAGLSDVGAVLASAVWGLVYGTVWTVSPGAAWIAQQCLVWLVISTAYPASGLPFANPVVLWRLAAGCCKCFSYWDCGKFLDG
jgi:hypothetical protein